MADWDNYKTTRLAEAFLTCKSISQIKKFLRDLLTEEEIIEFGNRLFIAELLYSGTLYTQIEKSTGMSSTTIARISKWLRRGMGGYNYVINRLHQHDSALRKVFHRK